MMLLSEWGHHFTIIPPSPPQGSVSARAGVTQAVYISKSVTIRGTAFTDSPDPGINPTTLDAQSQGRVLYITRDISLTVEGLRITGGDADGLGGSRWDVDAGGGIYAISATVTLNGCRVTNNTADWGGGVYLDNSANAMLSGNIISGNVAVGWGSGVYLEDSPNATLSGNTIISNTDTPGPADGGGAGVHLWKSPDATLNGNIIRGNTNLGYCCTGCWGASGGGVFLQDSGNTTLSNNTILNNRAGTGGGVFLVYNDNTTLSGNTIQGNTSRYDLCCWPKREDFLGRVEGYGIRGSTSRYDVRCSEQNRQDCDIGWGGGVYLESSDRVILNNNVIAENRASTTGSGILVAGSTVQLLHTTIARNTDGDGSGVYVTDWDSPISVTLTNTILVSHTVGVIVEDSTVTLEATLWGSGAWANDTDWDGEGTIITGTVNVWGDPAFTCAGTLCLAPYRIGPSSAALDKGVDAGVKTDIDYDPRPYQIPDLGADEYWPPGLLKYLYLPIVLRNR